MSLLIADVFAHHGEGLVRYGEGAVTFLPTKDGAIASMANGMAGRAFQLPDAVADRNFGRDSDNQMDMILCIPQCMNEDAKLERLAAQDPIEEPLSRHNEMWLATERPPDEMIEQPSIRQEALLNATSNHVPCPLNCVRRISDLTSNECREAF